MQVGLCATNLHCMDMFTGRTVIIRYPSDEVAQNVLRVGHSNKAFAEGGEPYAIGPVDLDCKGQSGRRGMP